MRTYSLVKEHLETHAQKDIPLDTYFHIHTSTQTLFFCGNSYIHAYPRGSSLILAYSLGSQYAHTYTLTNIYTHIHEHIMYKYTDTYTLTHADTHINMHTRVHTQMRIHTYSQHINTYRHVFIMNICSRCIYTSSHTH
jgi:hypothetical protein